MLFLFLFRASLAETVVFKYVQTTPGNLPRLSRAFFGTQEFHRLHVGDVLKFGESTRLYALEGPEELRPAEYESDNLVSSKRRRDAGVGHLTI